MIRSETDYFLIFQIKTQYVCRYPNWQTKLKNLSIHVYNRLDTLDILIFSCIKRNSVKQTDVSILCTHEKENEHFYPNFAQIRR